VDEAIIDGCEVLNTQPGEEIVLRQLWATTVLELRKICKEKGLPVSGLKEVLVQRISQFDGSQSGPDLGLDPPN
jgi:hypothetical protein